ncbi:PAS domain S-box protein [Spizellomyces punctatus DAOM BR117]|uniref:PAS domain S-box protein n=1 Tax=Spizellomyces punctatus (strain DAOM BR117) TaxID=645134 RepID=A0A0L0HDQ3_SPIPD|nr:PAS domain S-box protein [Spizellomyces punctatus DAOM BR117]KNC99141.1 PAS domain S-box protein [Spizellomyces punctatus DAOM BR117]|eukprot:XP_016607181.1 PAS domain S-box protein [Spizellomyces punctatus DAOM BR117]
MKSTFRSVPSSGQAPTDTLTDTFDTFLLRIKNGLFGVLFIVNKEEHGSHWIWAALESLIDHFQDLSLLFGFAPFAWQEEVDWLNLMFEIFSPEKFVQNSEPLYIFLISILGLVLLNTLWVGYSFSKNRFRFIWTLKFLRFTLGLFATVLYIPILERFVHSIVRCEESSLVEHGNEEEPLEGWGICWQGKYLFRSIATTIISLIFIALVLAVGATYFDFDPKLKDIESRPHSRIETLYIACRTVLIILSVVLATYGEPHSAVNKGIFAAVSVVASGILAFSYTWYIPYYSFKFSVFRAALQFNFFWCSLCSVFILFRPYSDIGIIYVLLSPIALLLGSLLIRVRRRAIEKMNPEKVDALTFELMVRFRLEKAGLLYKDPPKTNITMLTASPGDLSTESAQRSNAAQAEEKETLDAITNLFTIALRANPHSSLLHIFAGQFYLLRLGNRAQCMASLTKAENMDPKVDEASMIFRRQRLLNERFSGGDVIDFIAYEQNLSFAKKYERRAEAAVVQFWAELLRRNPSFRRLHHHGASLTNAISSTQQHYNQVLKLSPNSPHVYRMYAGFLINVLNDHKQGQELIERADELEGDARRSHEVLDEEMGEEEGGVSTGLDAGGWADNALVTISGELDNLGCIMNVNAQWLKLFGYRKHEIMQQNIDKIVPSPFKEVHDDLLKRYLDTGYAKVIDRPRQVLGINAAGYLFSVTLLVKQITSSEGKISFLGIMSKARTRPGDEFMILDSSFGILHATEPLSDILGHVDQGTPVGSWIPNLNFENVIKAGRSGSQVDFETRRTIYSLTVTGDKVVVGDLECYICRVKVADSVPVQEVAGLPADHPPVSGPDGRIGVCPMGYGRQVEEDRPDESGPNDEEAVPNASRVSHSSLNSSTHSAMPMSFSPHESTTNLPASNNASAKHLATEFLQLKRRTPVNSNDHEDDDDDEHRSTTSSITRSGTSSYIKNVIALKNIQTNRQLGYLRMAFIICLFVLGVLSVTENVRYKQLYTGVLNKLDKVRRRTDTCLRMVDIVEQVRTMQIGEGVGGFDSGLANVTEARQKLETDVTVLLSTVSDFANLVPGTVPYAEIQFYTASPSTPFQYTQVETVTLYDALQEAIASTRYILDTTGDAQGIRAAMEKIYINGPLTILRGLNTSAGDVCIEFQNEIISTKWSQLGRSAVGPGLCFLVFLMLIWPLYVKIQSNRQRFFQMFLDIPKEVVKGIYSSHLQRLAENEDDEDDMDVTDAGNRFALDKLLQDEEKGLISTSSPEGIDNYHSPSRNNRRRSVLYASILGRFEDPHKMLPKAGLLFLICLAYFFSAGGLTLSWLTDHNHIANDVYWSMQIPVLSRQADFRLREQVLQTYGYSDDGSPAMLARVGGNAPESAASLLTALARVQRGLMYGDPDMYTSSVIQAKDVKGLSELMLQDACTEGVPADCESFMNGALGTGLHAGLNRYTQLGREIVSLLPSTAAASTPSPTIPTNITGRMTSFRLLDQHYLPPPLTLTSTIRIQTVELHANWFNTFHLVFTILFCTVLGLLYVLLFHPLVGALSEDNRRTHVMLYMIPPEILSKVESIRRWAEVPGKKRNDERSHAYTERKASMAAQGRRNETSKVARTVEIV